MANIHFIFYIVKFYVMFFYIICPNIDFKSIILNSISAVSIITQTDIHFTNVAPFFIPNNVPETDPITHPIPCSTPKSHRIIPF